jgi:hypothetical protein
VRDSNGNPFSFFFKKGKDYFTDLYFHWSLLNFVWEWIARALWSRPNKKTETHKKQNSGNQPEFQSSIKKRTVNQTVVTFMSRI